MVQIDLTLSDSDDEKPPRAGNGSATASAGGRGQRERQQLMTEYLSPPKCNSTGSSKEGGRRVKKEPAAAPASFGAGSSSSGGSSSKAFVIDLSGENDDDDDVGGSQQRPPQEVACEAETNKGGGVIVDLSSSVSSSRGNPPATRDSVLEDDDDDDDDLIILDSEGEEDEPASPQQRLVVKPGAVPPPPRAAEPSKQRKRSPSPAIAADEEVGKRARFSQTTPDHVSGNDAAPISGPGSSLDGMMAKAELDAELALDDSEKLLSAKLEQDSEFASKYLDQLQEFYDRNFGDEDGGEGPSKPRKPRGCSVCGQKGHNRRRCPALSEQVDEDMDEVGDGGCAVAGGGLDDGVCGASSASSSGRGGHADWLWEDESMMAFERADVSSHHDMSYSQGKLWPVLRREAALGHVAPAYIVRMMVDALLDPGMLEKMQNNIDWKDLKGARTEHLQHLFASICQLIPAAGTNRYLPLEAPKGPRSYGVADPCSELCADVMAALKLLGTTSAADNKGSKGGKGGKGKGENSPEDESVSPAEKIKAEKSRRKQAKQARKDMYFRLQNVKYLKFIAALAASERACVEAGALSAGCHLFVAGIKVKSTLGTREVDLKDMVRMCIDAADCASASLEERGVVGEVLREIIAANAGARSARLGDVLGNVEQLVEGTVGGGTCIALDAMLGSPKWTLGWLMARWSAQPPSGDAAGNASMSPRQQWQSVSSSCTSDNLSERPCLFADEPGIDLALRCTLVLAAAACLGRPPDHCRGVLQRWLESKAQQAAKEGVEDMRWKAEFAIATF